MLRKLQEIGLVENTLQHFHEDIIDPERNRIPTDQSKNYMLILFSLY